jgi:hypothetical protein
VRGPAGRTAAGARRGSGVGAEVDFGRVKRRVGGDPARGPQVGVDVGAAEAVDGLLGVADQVQPGRLEPIGWGQVGAEHRVEDPPLDRVGVLELVDQRHVVAVTQGRADRLSGRGVPLEGAVELDEQIAERHRPPGPFAPGEVRGRVGGEPGEHVGDDPVRGGEQRLGRVDDVEVGGDRRAAGPAFLDRAASEVGQRLRGVGQVPALGAGGEPRVDALRLLERALAVVVPALEGLGGGLVCEPARQRRALLLPGRPEPRQVPVPDRVRRFAQRVGDHDQVRFGCDVPGDRLEPGRGEVAGHELVPAGVGPA